MCGVRTEGGGLAASCLPQGSARASWPGQEEPWQSLTLVAICLCSAETHDGFVERRM